MWTSEWSGSEAQIRHWSGLGVAWQWRHANWIQSSFTRNDGGTAFRGFVTFFDQPKDGAAEALADLARRTFRW
jgi:hypothetical protein